MTTPPAVFGRFGRTLARTEQVMTETLRRHLASRDVVPETWYVMQVLTYLGPVLSRPELTAELERSRTLTPESTRPLLARMAAEGLISGDEEVRLTDAGAELHRSLRASIGEPTARLLSRFPAEDVETTVRTLQAITEEAERELAAG